MATNVSDDLWHECTEWLVGCKAIPADHKANWPDSEIRVLALTLRDGVILCNLLNSIDPNALDMKDFNRKPQMAQVCIILILHTITYQTLKCSNMPEHFISRSIPGLISLKICFCQ